MGCIQNNKKVQIEITENNIIDSPSKITESNDFDYAIINELYLKNMAHRLTLV